MIKKLSFLLLIFTLLSGSCASIEAGLPAGGFEPEYLCLGPGPVESDINFNWHSSGNDNAVSLVRIYDEQGRFQNAFRGTVSVAPWGAVIHRVSVRGLEPGHGYYYSVSNDGINWSRAYSYRTGPAGDFTFAFAADPQINLRDQDGNKGVTTVEGWMDTMDRIAASGAAFIACAGDQVDNYHERGLSEYAGFFAPPELRNIPYATTPGNHDTDSPYLYPWFFNPPNEQHFEPVGGSGEEQLIEAASNYWFLYNNCLFVVLNTSAAPGSESRAAPYIEGFDKTLAAAVRAHQGAYDWLFVLHHKSTRSVARHGRSGDVRAYLAAGFESLMDKYGVHAVLAGHDHVYARSFALRGGQAVDTAKNIIIRPRGTLYLTATTASGVKYYDIVDPGNPPDYINVALQNHKPGYVIVEVTRDALRFNAYSTGSAEPVDSFTIER